MLEKYNVKMIYKGREIERNIFVHWSNTLEFTLKCLYPDAKILDFKRLGVVF